MTNEEALSEAISSTPFAISIGGSPVVLILPALLLVLGLFVLYLKAKRAYERSRKISDLLGPQGHLTIPFNHLRERTTTPSKPHGLTDELREELKQRGRVVGSLPLPRVEIRSEYVAKQEAWKESQETVYECSNCYEIFDDESEATLHVLEYFPLTVHDEDCDCEDCGKRFGEDASSDC